MILRAIYLSLLTVLFAGITHISIILLIPEYGSRDAWNLISSRSDPWSFRLLNQSRNSAAGLEDIDPYFSLGACTFNLDQSALRLSGLSTTSFWSISVFDEDGRVVYSMNSRTAIENKLDLLLLNPVQMVALKENPSLEIEKSIVVEAPVAKGFVVLRLFSPDLEGDNLDERAKQFTDIRCDTYSQS